MGRSFLSIGAQSRTHIVRGMSEIKIEEKDLSIAMRLKQAAASRRRRSKQRLARRAK